MTPSGDPQWPVPAGAHTGTGPNGPPPVPTTGQRSCSRFTVQARLPEADWQARVIDTAHTYGWRVCHHRPARTRKGWRTPVQGDAGLPDLILARNGVVLLVELKTDRGRVTAAQRAWLDQLGGHGRLWRPRDWPNVLEELRGKNGGKDTRNA